MVATRVAAVSLVALTAGCGRRPPAPLEQTISPPDTAHSVSFTTLSGGIKGITKDRKCPVTAHFDGAIHLSGISGTLRYRWERSTGVSGPVQELPIPAAAAGGAVDVAAKADEWPLSQRGQQMTVTDRIHVLAPVNALSIPLDLDAICY
jgi:hypothetical protein